MDSNWRASAACRGVAPAVFLPEESGDSDLTREAHRIAKETYCAACPVTGPCLEYALAHDENWGVWGNMTPRERRTVREHRQAVGRFAP